MGTQQASAETQAYRLDDRYTSTAGTVVLTGLQALTRILLDRHRLDAADGLRTGGLVSGYPGSPLGGFDLTLGRAAAFLREHDIVHVPGVNEELAASTVWGTQQQHVVGLRDGLRGVFGMWYGKSPGADRCGDAFKHANAFSVHPHGGVVAVVGDDPAAKSSSLPSQSETIFYDAAIPVLAAGSVQEVLHLGLQASELSRYTGLWTALKVVTNIADGVGAVDVSIGDVPRVHPQITLDGEPWVHRQRLDTTGTALIDRERDILQYRHRAAEAFAAANGINRIEGARGDAWIGIVAAGKTYYDVRQALTDLGFDEDRLAATGVRLLKLGMIYPLEREIVRTFAAGLSRVVVVEEKRGFIESALRDVLYDAAARPSVVGKRDADGNVLIPYEGEITADRIRPALAGQLAERVEVAAPPAPAGAPARRLIPVAGTMPATVEDLAAVARTATYCSGCPHNRSTVLPEGSVMGGGVGCHGMSYGDPRLAEIPKFGVVPMGSEGVPWIGLAPFAATGHLFQNLGDGTFTHSGLLGIRACVAAGVNITYKILYNGYVAMTGGQDVAGGLTVAAMTRELHAEGVARITVCTDEPDRYRGARDLAPGVGVVHRDDLEAAQDELRAVQGVTVLIYDQACAAEVRRHRNRGALPAADRVVVINELVCEGCGDCGAKSHCLSVQPVDTELGRKTQIHRSSCNSDYSCLLGDCPSFVTLRPARRRRRRAGPGPTAVAARGGPLPEPATRPDVDAGPYSVYMIGIGGTGVVTANHVLATAALLEGTVTTGLDQTGMSQKAGPVASHLTFSREPLAERAAAIGLGGADLFLAFDALSGAQPLHLGRAGADRTRAMVSRSAVPTAAIVNDPSRRFPDVDALLARIGEHSRELAAIDAQAAAEAELGDHMSANVVLVGAAYQRGWLPLSAESIEGALTLNGVAVERNLAAFRLGRRLVLDVDAVVERVQPPRLGSARLDPSAAALVAAGRLIRGVDLPDEVRGVAERLAAELVDYQSEELAGRYLALVGAARAAEASIDPHRHELSAAVARSYFKVLAYKDEYEVARLHLKLDVAAEMERETGDAVRPTFHLHPPLLRSLGMRRKIEVGSWIVPGFRALRAARKLRGTWADPFGPMASRRMERRVIDEYRDAVEAACTALTAAAYDAAVTTADAPQALRGYEGVKEATLPAFRDALQAFARATAAG